ncbi:retrotransposon protein, putative, ty1-copia subclass [Tanacetum coccineum]
MRKKLSQRASTSGIFTTELYPFPSTSWVYDMGCGTHIYITTRGLRGSKKLKPGALSLYVGDGHRVAVDAIGEFHFCLPNHEESGSESTRIRCPIDRLCLYVDAKEHELGDLDIEVWELVDLPPDGKTIGHKWLFKKKTGMDGAVHTYKARLVAKGFTQTPRIYYEETFSPVADIRAIRILIAIAVFYDYDIWQTDVKTASHGYINVELYMKATWKASGSYVTFIILYVDDILIMGNKIPMLQDVKSYLGRWFAMKDLGEAAYIIGIKIYRDRSKCTRPDVAFAQNITSRFQQTLGDAHWTTVKNILKYLRNTKDMFLVYGGDTKRELRVSCYTDAGYLMDADDMRSQTGYVFILNGEAVWIRKFIYGLGVVPTIEEPINIYCDNIRAIAIAKDHRVTKGARHFHAKVHYLLETIEMGDVKIEKVDTDDNLADPFTKALTFPKHFELTEKIGMIPASSLM